MKGCPFCGATPTIKVVPMWHGDHGYTNAYKIYITCENAYCPMIVETIHYNTLEGESVDDCFKRAEKDWDKRISN